MALLPHERRAARARQTAIATSIGVTLLGLLAWFFGADVIALFDASDAPATTNDGWPVTTRAGEDPGAVAAIATDDTIAPAPPAGPEPPVEDPREDPTAHASVTATIESGAPEEEPARITELVTEQPFGNARGFRDAIRRAGASPEDADAIVAALEAHVDFRRCRPEHMLRFVRNEGGELETFEYRVGRTERYRARRTPDGFEGERVPIEIELRRVAKGGNISGSLGSALDNLGLGRSLVGAFVEVFERRISFTKDTRTGDTFRIIVDEQYVDGELLGYGTVHAVEYTGERVGQMRGFWFDPTGKRGEFYDPNGRTANGGWLRTPLRYDHISSGFDLRRRHPVLKRIVPHHGVDYAASSGTPVWAAADGTVTFAGYKGANGNLIAIRHADGHETFYAHLSRIAGGIKRGTKVSQRQIIGAVGSTGRSTGPHLHFALKRRGRFLDPLTQLNGPGKPLPSRYMGRFKTLKRKLERELEAIVLAPAPTEEGPEEEPPAQDVFHEEGEL